MTKKELKSFLAMYFKIREAVKGRQTETVITKYRRKTKIAIPNWANIVEKCLIELMNSEDELERKIIDGAYLKGRKDRELIMRLPVTDSSYYRLKVGIEEKLYELCILYGCVTKDDIMAIKI